MERKIKKKLLNKQGSSGEWRKRIIWFLKESYKFLCHKHGKNIDGQVYLFP